MSALHCFFCGGKECKYENYKLWTQEKGYAGVNALEGLYSSWITSSVLAMQRPSTRLIKEYNLIEVFLKENIMAVFNLQQPGEHLSCGDGVEAASGFSYLPETFMDNGISYYNFGWTDMETPDVDLMLTIVNVMSFALENSRKISVHCHAGLGRTGLTIACYLVYSENIPAQTAILVVRGKRPLSVQTKKQSLFVTNFENHLKKLKLVYPGAVDKATKALLNIQPLNFEEFIANQRRWIKNPELRYLRYIPKVLHVIIGRLLQICGNDESTWYKAFDAFCNFEGLKELDGQTISLMNEINNSEWGKLKFDNDAAFLVNLMLHWLITLRSPLVGDVILRGISIRDLTNEQKLELLGKEEFETINYILKFFREIPSISLKTLDNGMDRLALYLTSQRKTLSNYIEYVPPAVLQKVPSSIQQPNLADAYRTKMVESFQQLGKAQTAAIQNIGAAIKPMDMMQSLKNQAEALGQIKPMEVMNSIRHGAEAMAHSIQQVGKDMTPTSTSPVSPSAKDPLMPVEAATESSSSSKIVASLETGPLSESVTPAPKQESHVISVAETIPLPALEIKTKAEDIVPQPRSHEEEEEVQEESTVNEAPTDEFIKLLKHIYKSFSVKEDNSSAIATSAKPTGFPQQEWKSPSEILLKNNGSVENLAVVFKNGHNSGEEAITSALMKKSSNSLSTADLPSASMVNEQGEKLAPGESDGDVMKKSSSSTEVELLKSAGSSKVPRSSSIEKSPLVNSISVPVEDNQSLLVSQDIAR